MTIDFKALGAKAAAEGKNMTEPVKGGGGDYTPPAAGPARARLVGYIEIGKHDRKFKGVPKTNDRCLLVFELSGPNHQPAVGEDGAKYPQRITVDEKMSLNEKANFFKLFQRMNYRGGAVHMAQLLGESFKVNVVHRKFMKQGDAEGKPTGIAAELRNDEGYTIHKPYYEVRDQDGNETGEWKELNVDAAISPIRCFIWDQADMDQWKSIFIDGKYDDRKNEKTGETIPGKSKNVFQARVMQAKNFKGSPIETLLKNNGQKLDIPDVDQPGSDDDDTPPARGEQSAGNPAADPRPVPQGEAATDALAGIVGA